ncbi:MAG TPA: metalloregulator ArsR/SmtB family transcription factor [Baekduia sp.]|nr:metalloregulator ArsR/SmtB family transcription factor [Baekduia sp.]
MANDELSDTFAALADPTRRAMLARLARGEASVNELAEPFDMSLQAVSKHLKVLENAGLVTRTANGQTRPARIEGAPMKDAAEWLDGYSQFFEGSFDKLAKRLQEMQERSKPKPRARKK